MAGITTLDLVIVGVYLIFIMWIGIRSSKKVTNDDDNYVWIADGVTRKLSSPKKKKLKHLDLKPVVLESIANKLIENKKVFDSELRSAIQNTQYFKKV